MVLDCLNTAMIVSAGGMYGVVEVAGELYAQCCSVPEKQANNSQT